MPVRLDELPAEIRESTLTALLQRRAKLVRDLADGLSTEPGMAAVSLSDFSGILLTVLAAAVTAGWIDARTTSIQDLRRFSPPLTVRQLIRAVHHAERTAIGELSVEDSIGANAKSWQLTARAISAAAVEIVAMIAETHGASNALRDPLTTLMSPALFEWLEPVVLLPTSVTIPGAAMWLGQSNREIVKLLRARELTAARRGRPLYIERDAIDGLRHRG